RAWSPPTRSSKSSISDSVTSVPATVAKAGSVSALADDAGVSGPVQAANKRTPTPPSKRGIVTLHPFWNIFMKLRLFLCHRLQQSLHFFVFRQLAQLETDIAFHLLKGHRDDLGILQFFHDVVTKGRYKWLGNLSSLEGKYLLRESGVNRALLDPSQVSAFLGRNTVFRILLRQLFKRLIGLGLAKGLLGSRHLHLSLRLTHGWRSPQQDMCNRCFFHPKLFRMAVVVILNRLVIHYIIQVVLEITAHQHLQAEILHFSGDQVRLNVWGFHHSSG